MEARAVIRNRIVVICRAQALASCAGHSGVITGFADTIKKICGRRTLGTRFEAVVAACLVSLDQPELAGAATLASVAVEASCGVVASHAEQTVRRRRIGTYGAWRCGCSRRRIRQIPNIASFAFTAEPVLSRNLGGVACDA